MQVIEFISFLHTLLQQGKLHMIYNTVTPGFIPEEAARYEIIDVCLSDDNVGVIFKLKSKGVFYASKTDSYEYGFPLAVECDLMKELFVPIENPPKFVVDYDFDDIEHPLFELMDDGCYFVHIKKLHSASKNIKYDTSHLFAAEREKFLLEYNNRDHRSSDVQLLDNKIGYFFSENGLFINDGGIILDNPCDVVPRIKTKIRCTNVIKHDMAMSKEEYHESIRALKNTIAIIKWQIMADSNFGMMQETDDEFTYSIEKI